MHDFMGIDPELETIDEWDYTTKDGTQVHFSRYGHHCVLMADLPNSFLYIFVLRESMPDAGAPLNRKNIEEFADMFDYKGINNIGCN